MSRTANVLFTLVFTLTSLPAQAAPAAAPVAPAAAPEPAWPATFEPGAVGTYVGASRPNVMVIAATSAASSAAAALRAAISASKTAGIVMDAQAIGAVEGLDDRAIVERAKGQPVGKIAVVRVFESGPGEPPSVIVTFYAPDGSVSNAITGAAGTPVPPSGGGVSAAAGVSTQAAEAVSAVGEEAEATRATEKKATAEAQREYDRSFLWVQNWIGVSAQTGAVVASWSQIKQGTHGDDVRGAQLYRIVGREDLYKKYKRRQAIRLGVGIPVTVGGYGLMFAGLGVLLSNLIRQPPDFGYDDPLMMGPSSAPTAVSNVGAGVMMGVGGAMWIGGLIFIGLFRPHPATKSQAMEMIQDHNEKLRQRLGLPDKEARLRLAPMVGLHNGLVLQGRF